MKTTKRLYPVLFLSAVAMPVCLLAGDLIDKDYRFEASTSKPLRIRFEVDAGRIEIEPGRSSRNVDLSFRFDDKRHELSVEFDESENYLRIFFDLNDWFKDNGDDDGYSPRMSMQLPQDVEIEVDWKIKAGECNVELGGLHVRQVNLRVLAGQTTVAFSKPNKKELTDLEIDSKFGELRVEKLGNANFKYASINGVIGSLYVDLTADEKVKADCEVEIGLNIGETQVYLPVNDPVRFSVSKFLFFSSVDVPSDYYKRGKYFYSDNYDKYAHSKMDVSISPGLGTLDIRSR